MTPDDSVSDAQLVHRARIRAVALLLVVGVIWLALTAVGIVEIVRSVPGYHPSTVRLFAGTGVVMLSAAAACVTSVRLLRVLRHRAPMPATTAAQRLRASDPASSLTQCASSTRSCSPHSPFGWSRPPSVPNGSSPPPTRREHRLIASTPGAWRRDPVMKVSADAGVAVVLLVVWAIVTSFSTRRMPVARSGAAGITPLRPTRRAFSRGHG